MRPGPKISRCESSPSVADFGKWQEVSLPSSLLRRAWFKSQRTGQLIFDSVASTLSNLRVLALNVAVSVSDRFDKLRLCQPQAAFETKSGSGTANFFYNMTIYAHGLKISPQ